MVTVAMKTSKRLLLADVASTWRQGLAISLLLACAVRYRSAFKTTAKPR